MSKQDQRAPGQPGPAFEDEGELQGWNRAQGRLALVEPLRNARGQPCGYRVRLDNGTEAELPLAGSPRLH